MNPSTVPMILELTDDPRVTGKVHRVPLGTKLYLGKCAKLQDMELEISCLGPLGDAVQVEDGSFLFLDMAGPYHLAFTDPYVLERREITMTVLVDPVIKQHDNDTGLTLDKIAVQSHLMKCCGALDNWEKVFMVSVESGYNMIHLTPVQQLGVSRSAYSLHSHLSVSPTLGIASDHTTKDYTQQLDVLSCKLKEIHTKTGLYFLSDVVWNHVSICNPDIRTQHESYYNLHNTPNLIPAYFIDVSIAEFSYNIQHGKHPEVTSLKSEGDTEKIISLLRQHLEAVSARLTQLYRINPALELHDFTETCGDLSLDTVLQNMPQHELVQALWSVDHTSKRYGGKVDLKVLNYTLCKRGVTDEKERKILIQDLIKKFNNYTVPVIVQGVFDRVFNAVKGTVNYRFVNKNGPKMDIKSVPLIERYFHIPELSLQDELELDIYNPDHGKRIMTCNGWTMGESISDMSTTKAYLHRDVVIWGDSVKLRYGSCPADSPWLWGYMEQYTCDMAGIFHGFRIDNCHNTPIHVGEYMIRAARRIRNNLYVVAELFTNSEEKDCEIINRMGISSCIRELSQSRSPQHLGELAYHYGESKPCGSFIHECRLGDNKTAAYLLPSRPHALLMDQTHDNPCPFDQHPVLNVLAMSAVMVAAKCSIGSNRGYDELVPYHIHVVNEERLYLGVNSKMSCEGIKPVKRALIELHHFLETEGYHETFVDQKTPDMMIVTRHNTVTCEKILVVIATQFNEHVVYPDSWDSSPHITLPGAEFDILLEIEMQANSETAEYEENQQFITGLESVQTKIRHNVKDSHLVRFNTCQDEQPRIYLKLVPGSIAVIKVKPAHGTKQSVSYCNDKLLSGGNLQVRDQLNSVCSELTLVDLNYVLYRCGQEERVDGCGGVYNVPGHGELVYAGIQGFLSVLDEIRAKNDMGHALCRNLCEGWWCAEYTVNRLCLKDRTRTLGMVLQGIFQRVRDIPNYMRPKIFDTILRLVFKSCEEQLARLLPCYAVSSKFQKQLIQTSIQLFGEVKGTGIASQPEKEQIGSLAAGLPHFSHGFMRCWGRDTFIALPGLLISTGRLEEASDLIVGFARTLRHGLIPNLLSEHGLNPRYNCRDAAWWWCRAVKLLWKERPEILQERVHRMYGSDDKPCQHDCSVLDVVQEILTRHVHGISFVEYNAGPALDEHLKYEGFLINASIDLDTGFVQGGSKHNCGTWMDKVGSSDNAGNRGLPATPRDGSAIELVALCHQTVSWMSQLHQNKMSSYEGITMDTVTMVNSGRLLYKDWASKIHDNFEKYFWMEDEGYYKDTVNSSVAGQDRKLRPNQAVALVVAPDLMSPSRRETAVYVMGKSLAGPLGMCTLSPCDTDYRPFYDNSNDSVDFRTAHGFNYHQGPEWLWCMGFYLRAKASSTSDKLTFLLFLKKVLGPHRIMISTSHFRGLTELTNKDGAYCSGSCPTQAWSSGCLLELFADLQQA